MQAKGFHLVLAALSLVPLTGCSQEQKAGDPPNIAAALKARPQPQPQPQPAAPPLLEVTRKMPDSELRTEVALEENGGTFVVPVQINEAISLKFMIDSGASLVTIPSDVASTLVRAGTISRDDYLGTQTFTLADGSNVEAPVLKIRSLRIGSLVLHDVQAGVTNGKGTLLLGQSFLSRLKNWSIDNNRHALLMNVAPAQIASVDANRSDSAPPAGIGSPTPTDLPARPTSEGSEPTGAELAATAQVIDYFQAWSRLDDVDGQSVRPFYASEVNFFGKQVALDALMSGVKLRFAHRWPHRNYLIQPGAISTSCVIEFQTCTVNGRVTWNVSNYGYSRRSSGVASYSFTLKDNLIVRESGRVVLRGAPNSYQTTAESDHRP